MKKSELKEMLRPLVQECVQESVQQIILESGLLTSVISEVMKGFNNNRLVEQKVPNSQLVIEDDEDEDMRQMQRRASLNHNEKRKITETKKHLLDSVGKSGYSGIFEGIEDTIPDEVNTKSTSAAGNPLSGIAANDPGIDISNLINPAKLRALVTGKPR